MFHRKFCITLAALLLACGAGPSIASTDAACPTLDARALTLGQAALRAACLAPARARGSAQSREARALIDDRRAQRASQWSLQAQPSLSAQRGLRGSVSTDTAVHDTSASLSLHVERSLWDGGARRSRLLQAERDAAAAILDEDTIALDTEADFVGVWIDVRKAEAQELATAAALVAAKASAAAVQARVDAGDATRVELLAAQSAVAQAERERIAAEISLSRSKGLLAVLLGWPPSEPLVLVGDDGSALAPVGDTQGAWARHPKALAQHERVEALKAALVAARAEGGASLSLTGQTGPNASRSNSMGMGQRSSSQWQTSAGLSFRLPLSDGGTRAAAVARAQSQLEAALATQVSVLRQLEETWWRAHSDWRGALADEEASAVALRAAQLSEQAERGRYAAGAGRLTDLLQAQSDVSQRQSQADEARAQRLRSQTALRQAAGLSALMSSGETR